MSRIKPATLAGDAGVEDRAPWLATMVARAALRWSGYPGRRLLGAPRRKTSLQRGGQRFTVTTPDGVTLDAWYSPASPTPGSAPAKLPVVMLHGWIEVKEFHFGRAWSLNRAGHDVILFDHRAHGCSKGRCATFGVRERHDLAAVVQAATERGYIHDRYITFGYSMGAATALQHAPDDPRVAGVIAFAPFAEFTEAINSFRVKFAPWMDRRWLLRGFERATREAGFRMQEASTLEAVRRLETPLLLVEAGRDVNLPPEHHVRKVAEAKHRGPMQYVCIDEATHCSLCRRVWPELNETVAAFCAGLA